MTQLKKYGTESPSAAHFERLRAQAFDRGERDYARGIGLSDCPFSTCATDERSQWRDGWAMAAASDSYK